MPTLRIDSTVLDGSWEPAVEAGGDRPSPFLPRQRDFPRNKAFAVIRG